MRIRKFLNKPGFHSVAAVYVEVSGKKNNPNTSLIISDCGRSVTLDVTTYDEANKNNTLFKVNTLIDALTQFRDAIERTGS